MTILARCFEDFFNGSLREWADRQPETPLYLYLSGEMTLEEYKEAIRQD